MPSITITLKIPFECDPPGGLVPALTFTHWLPLGRDKGIAVDDGDVRFILWFDEKCTWWASQPTADELKNYVNVLAHYVNVEVQALDLSDELVAYVQTAKNSESSTKINDSLQVEYGILARKILLSVLQRVNRLIAFARSRKGQYWLTEHNIDHDQLRSCFLKFDARGRVDEGPWFTFVPPTTDSITIRAGGTNSYIEEDDWPAFRDFVVGAKKPDLVGELLAGAEYLLRAGHRRSALTEAVTALEIVVFRFSQSPKAEAEFGDRLGGRLGLSTLYSQVSHLGLSATVKYLLPTILSEDILPGTILSECQEALTQRQNVVHNGQRDVDERFTQRAISAIRRFCDILNSLTQTRSD
ncbi:DNA double-strand break repair nuclease NurA [Burkholderia sp. USMB20]|uniref:DNA double-strand break repair nuclease NurA n=1 Tax=Burkholderia sp. USMB20 TaxID=1571773 RepID=UPI000AD412D8|nr:DNA double-strand break repair nuclease NurA [Burkholderia sp. USMB20]TGN97945.1 hypothetical protein PL79_009065 [Burkholderia sp. USMB20]